MQGSVINRLQERAAVIAIPKVGDGATLYLHSDRHAYTVRHVRVSSSGKTITIRATKDKVRRIDNNGMGESQTYEYETVEPDYKFPELLGEVFKSVSGKPFRRVYYDEAADALRMSETILRVGYRDEYYDLRLPGSWRKEVW